MSTDRDLTQVNVVLIMADDLGFADISAYGEGVVETPAIDSLAKKGLRFDNAYAVAPVCTPSRYAALTGVYPWRVLNSDSGQLWATHRSPNLFHKDQPTLGRVFQASSYRTGYVGKWHLGLINEARDWNVKLAPGPLEHGFDYFYGEPSNRYKFYIDGHYVDGIEKGERIESTNADVTFIPPSVRIIGYELDAKVLTSKAVQFIDKNAGEDPFFLIFAPHNVHTPYTPHDQFRGASDIGVYGDFIKEFDWSVSEILKALKAAGVDDNTLVIVTSDNGGKLDNEAMSNGHYANGELLGQKTDLWEGGIRIPFIVSGPGVPNGALNHAPISLIDLPRTMSQLLDQNIPKEMFQDSRDFLPILRSGVAPKEIMERTLVFNWGNRSSTFAVRKGQWVFLDRAGSGGVSAGSEMAAHRPMYTTYAEGGLDNSDYTSDGRRIDGTPDAQLYNLSTDKGQHLNVIQEYPEVATEMKAALLGVQSEELTIR